MHTKIIRKFLPILIHILAWLVIGSLPWILFQVPRDTFNLKIVASSWLALIVFYYFNYYVLIPRFLTREKFFLFGLSIFLLLSLSFSLTYFLQDREHFDPDKRLKRMGLNVDEMKHIEHSIRVGRGMGSVMISFLVLAVSTSIRITGQWYANEKIRKEMENQKLTAELSFLKSQINPHFFFNTLNSIYSLATRKSEKTPEAIIKLSLLMRYIIYESDKDFVPLDKELEYIRNYVELQRLRIKDDVIIIYNIEGEYQNKQIEPLLLLPFIENAFKHGIDYTRACEILIHLIVKDDQLKLVVENPLIKKQPQLPEAHSGIGLANSRKRLQLLYQEQYKLNVIEENEKFRIELYLNIKKHELPHRG
jgi:two-component system, LytTR family, sensor kinase